MINSVRTMNSRLSQEVAIGLRQSPLTWTFLLLIWAVEFFARFAVDSKMNFNEMMGFQLSQPWTYISYAFAHKDMGHIAGNSVMLLFAKPVESHYGGKAFLGIAGSSIVLGAFGALLFYLWSGELNDEPAVGASTVGIALLIAGINVILQDRVPENAIGDQRYWIRKSVTWSLVVAILAGIAHYAKVTNFTTVPTAAVAFVFVVALPAVGLKAVLSQIQYWELRQCGKIRLRMVRSVRCLFIPVLLLTILLYGEITGTSEWFYGNSGHAGGALVGLIASLGANWLSWRKQPNCPQPEVTGSSCPQALLWIGVVSTMCYMIIGIYSAWALMILAYSWVSTY